MRGVGLFCLWLLSALSVRAQWQTDLGYAPINEGLLMGTRWRYTYTTHSETNTVIHKADAFYEHFLYFKYDYGYSVFLNGTYSGGDWKLNEAQNQVYAPFRNIAWWRLRSFSEETLVLEYSLHAKANYCYHFVRVSAERSPFPRLPNELPDIEVRHYDKNESPYKYRYLKAEKGKRGGRGEAKPEKPSKPDKNAPPEPEPELLQVELVGGGFFGGIDPVYRNNLVIKTDGQVVKEYQTERLGLRVTRRHISRQSLERLVEFMESKQFFEMQPMFLCESPECSRRMGQSPRPIALRIALTKGYRRKVVSISIWEGLGVQNHWVSYPPEIDLIVKAIENTALFAEETK